MPLIQPRHLLRQSHFLVAVTGWCGKIVTAIAQLVSVRLIIDAVGVDQYAVFALLLALTGWFALVDFGLGASLQNYISECRVKGGSDASYRLAVLILLLTSFFGFVFLAWLASPYLGPLYLKGDPALPEKAKIELFFLASLFAIASGIGATSYRIWYANHKGYWSNLLPAVLAVASLGGIWLIGQGNLENKLIWIVAVWMGLNGCIPFILLVALTLGDWHEAQLTRYNISVLLHRGGHFFYFSILATITLQVDYLILSQTMSNRDVVVYSIATKIFGILFFFYNAFLLALWPVFSELLARGNWNRVFFHIKLHIVGGMVLMLVGTALLVIEMQSVVNLFSPQEQVIIPVSLIFLLGIYQIIRVWSDTFALVLNCTSMLKPFFVLVPIQAALSVIFQFAGASWLGLDGLVMGIIASFLLTVVCGLPWYIRRYHRAALLKIDIHNSK